MHATEEMLTQRRKGAERQVTQPLPLRGFAALRAPTSSRGFTLVELIVVMAVLAMVLAFSAPSLSRSMRQRNLEGEAVRFLAATEYGRNEAISQGIPMVIWIDEQARQFGIEPRAGFVGDTARAREFTLHPDVQIELEKVIGKNAKVQPIEFEPDGAAAITNIESVVFKDRFATVVMIGRTPDGWGYEILEEAK